MVGTFCRKQNKDPKLLLGRKYYCHNFLLYTIFISVFFLHLNNLSQFTETRDLYIAIVQYVGFYTYVCIHPFSHLLVCIIVYFNLIYLCSALLFLPVCLFLFPFLLEPCVSTLSQLACVCVYEYLANKADSD